ncbi:hypothetical protein P171DRAFT_489033 [Karstenula rhodostoma CBS 690.94]|uniref:Uncharacterized protein n=1 Tax=Karstenula rhodostoma CBS 690.94 TaxID=1392251 RepID=A0A9P4PAF8_9PLEO|nr:hypothetical protein P171DRAFT_489033 [Karstenula rhodostoma CBS 690.94]
MHLRNAITKACSTFALTNIDDLFVLVTFFALAAAGKTTSLKIILGTGLVETSEELLDSMASMMKKAAVDKLLEFILADRVDLSEPGDGLESSTNSSSVENSNSGSSPSPIKTTYSNTSGQKRHHSRSNDDGDSNGNNNGNGETPSEDETGDHGRGRKRGRVPEKRPRLKCPFYQRDPDRYTRASCRGIGFQDLAKLKDYLKRVHIQALRRPWCREEMSSSDACDQHLQRDDICAKHPHVIDERTSAELWKKLEFKKPPFSMHDSIEAKWRLMDKALFPDDREILSPYDQPGISSRMERLLAEEPEIELVKELGSGLDPIVARIRGRIPRIIKRCKSRILGLPDDGDYGSEEADLSRVNTMGTCIQQKNLETGLGSSTQLSHCDTHAENVSPRDRQPTDIIHLPKQVHRYSTYFDEATCVHPPTITAKSLEKRPQGQSLPQDVPPRQSWSALNTRDPTELETQRTASEPPGISDPILSQNQSSIEAGNTLDTSWEFENIPNAAFSGPSDFLFDWNHLSSDFVIDPSVVELDEGRGVYAWD